jgi:hypothetical protein
MFIVVFFIYGFLVPVYNLLNPAASRSMENSSLFELQKENYLKCSCLQLLSSYSGASSLCSWCWAQHI